MYNDQVWEGRNLVYIQVTNILNNREKIEQY